MTDDDREGARREVTQRARHGARTTRDEIALWREMARFYRARQGGVPGIDADVLADYEAALREEAAAIVEVADAMRAELGRRGVKEFA